MAHWSTYLRNAGNTLLIEGQKIEDARAEAKRLLDLAEKADRKLIDEALVHWSEDEVKLAIGTALLKR